MKSKVFSVFDQKAGIYHSPFLTHNRATAMRMMSDVLSRGEHSFAAHPTDFTLFELGEFDDNSGTFECHPPLSVCMLAELLSKGE